MGLLSRWFTVPGSNAAREANENLSDAAKLNTEYTNSLRNAISPLVQNLPNYFNNAATAMNTPLSKLTLKQYQAPQYTMPNAPTNQYSGVNLPQINIDNIPDVYKPSSQLLSNFTPFTTAQNAYDTTLNNYNMNANDALSNYNNQMSANLLKRGLGGRQGGVSSMEASALAGLANQSKRMNAEGALAALNAANAQSGQNANLASAQAGLERTSAQDAIDRANMQNTWRTSDFNNQMALSGANQSFAQQDYQNQINNINQLRDWLIGDTNQYNQTLINEGTYNTNQQQTNASNQMNLLQALVNILNPGYVNGSSLSDWGTVAQNANSNLANNTGNLSGLAGIINSLFPNALKI